VEGGEHRVWGPGLTPVVCLSCLLFRAELTEHAPLPICRAVHTRDQVGYMMVRFSQ
jgi:hypothetical protein